MQPTSTVEPSTFAWEETHSKLTRRRIYYLLHGLVGLITCLFNGLLILAYLKRVKIRKHVSLVMLSLFLFCFFHGLVVGLVYPLQRVFRYKMHPILCVISTLAMDFADEYIVFLLPALAVERLIFLKFPFVDRKTMRNRSACLLIGLVMFSMVYTWLPLVPNLALKGQYIFSNNTQRQRYLDRFYRYYTCDNKLNRKNTSEPILTLMAGLTSVFIIIISYIWMLLIARKRFNTFSSMTAKKKTRLKKAAIVVMVVALTFIFTMLPYGIVIQIATSCDTNTSSRENSLCNGITLELRFVFSILAHLGNIIGPMMFAFLSPNIRQSISVFLGTCLTCHLYSKAPVIAKPRASELQCRRVTSTLSQKRILGSAEISAAPASV